MGGLNDFGGWRLGMCGAQRCGEAVGGSYFELRGEE